MSYTYTISCRMTRDDRDLLRAHATRLGLSPSDYLRYLVRLPVEAKDVASGGWRCVVLDTCALATLSHELVKWGHHYNQAVHAMNTIALFIRRGRLEYEYFVETIDRIDEGIALLNASADEMARDLAQIMDTTLVGDA